jgi:hypothetical protein
MAFQHLHAVQRIAGDGCQKQDLDTESQQQAASDLERRDFINRLVD